MLYELVPFRSFEQDEVYSCFTSILESFGSFDDADRADSAEWFSNSAAQLACYAERAGIGGNVWTAWLAKLFAEAENPFSLAHERRAFAVEAEAELVFERAAARHEGYDVFTARAVAFARGSEFRLVGMFDAVEYKVADDGVAFGRYARALKSRARRAVGDEVVRDLAAPARARRVYHPRDAQLRGERPAVHRVAAELEHERAPRLFRRTHRLAKVHHTLDAGHRARVRALAPARVGARQRHSRGALPRTPRRDGARHRPHPSRDLAGRVGKNI